MPMLPPPGASSSSGIDIRDALAILSARAPHDHDHPSHDGVVPRELRGMGQIVDLNATLSNPDPDPLANNTTITTTDDGGVDDEGKIADGRGGLREEDEIELEQRRKDLESARARRSMEIRNELSSMTTSELLRTIFTAQEGRVATYRTFDDGLSAILSSGKVASYPTLCATVTASFAVLSDTINYARAALSGRAGKQYDIYVTSLQECECKKLNLTAALHLERLRLYDVCGGGGGGGGASDEDENDGNDVTVMLLRESMRKLKNELSLCAGQINDILDEMRCIAVDVDV
ncbi:hypothetical protein ACHAXA_009118 [Cyclostephanos tholiformis]|uniref:Uncharacterized protein n=1 Tax=Cyclostephanos tholiformis TaxID=382380 RepID=A0ABD3RXG0_9STRA